MLEAADAKLTIASDADESTLASPADYLYMNMDKKIIRNVILPAYDPSFYRYGSYKVS